jgi:small conductance mechanosensitive channel
LVELITLRMTVLRDLEGVRHFIPHGTVTSVSNLTHGWSRAMMDVSVAYKENVDQVITVLMQLGREMRRDPVLGRHILEDPEMLGVDSLADSGVTIKFLLKTRPLQQWPVKREMLRRIKNRFDELGIEIPFPHQTVYHHFPDQPQTGVDHLLAQRHSA